MPVQTKKDYRTDVTNGAKRAPATPERLALIDGLNQDLAAEYQAVLMYTDYSARLVGPYRRELRALFQAEIGDEQRHAQFLADKIVALGGVPTTQPVPVPLADDTRDMLEQALRAEKQAIADYGKRISQAEVFGDIGLKVALEAQVADETGHKEELERILAGWNEQNRERVRNEDRWQDDGGQG
jgi:bacterioferritin